MIEIIYKDDSEKNNTDTVIKLPKNIRQIGEGGLDNQIYIEDNIMNYLKKIPENNNDIRYGVLLGTVKKGYGYTYIFINGAIDVEDIVENTVIFSDEIWTSINDNIRRYFNNLKVVGWFTSLNYAYNNDMPYINRIHLDNFAGIDKVYLRMDRIEDEENFYIYGSGGLKKQPGYHVYYEKNYNMEDYIYGSNVTKKFVDASKQMKADKVNMASASKDIGNGKSASSNNKGTIYAGTSTSNVLNNTYKEKVQESNKGAKYGIEENGTRGKVINVESAFKTLSRNIASIAMVLMLMGTVALVSNENAMDKVRGRIAQILDGGADYQQQNIPVAGIINETDTTTKQEESITDEVTTKENEADASTENKTSDVKPEEKETTDEKTAQKEPEDNKATDVAVNGTPTNADKEQLSEHETTITSVEENTTAAEEPTASVSMEGTKYYIVKQGDTLTSIAMHLYNDASVVNKIIKLNGISNGDYIKEGDKLIIP